MKYMLFCEHCQNKMFTNGNDLQNLVEIPTASIPKRGDGKNKETFQQRKKLKCPKCGYVFKIVKLDNTPDTPEKPEAIEREEPKDLSDKEIFGKRR